ncbi:MAG: DNA primase, partial [Pseudomonadota bacterium]
AQTRDPKAAERRSRETRLVEVMEQAVQFYGLAFRSAQGQQARDYSERRGLTADTLKQFEIGFAPNARTQITEHFREKGALEDAVGAGLVIKPDDGGAPYDRFRGRLMFPIRDPRGRCIAFGGRALSQDTQAKYLNSPETDLFHKGRMLFNHGPASNASRNTGALIVAEGYMDVIALAQGGFDHSVAPLGTAVTEEQIALIWRMTPEPVIALDGDKAGLRAAYRVVDLALPLLKPGHSLRFCLMPDGQDPDDLIRAGGPNAMEDALSSSLNMIDMLWRREIETTPLDTPEKRAALDQRLREALGRIADAGVRNHYAAEIKQRRADLFRPMGQTSSRSASVAGNRTKRSKRADGASPGARSSTLAGGSSGNNATRIREAAILLICLHNLRHLGALENLLETLTISTEAYRMIFDGLLEALGEGSDPRSLITKRIGEDPIGLLSRVPQAAAHPLARPEPSSEKVGAVLNEAILRHQARLDFEAERAEAQHDFQGEPGEDVTWRLRQAGLQRLNSDLNALAGEDRIKAQPQSSDLQRMLENETYKRKKKPKSSTNQ